MHINKFRGIVREKLGPGGLLDEKGRVLYSSVHSLREWRTGVYVLGLDPGGTTDDHKSIGDDIQRNEMNERGYCALTKERWDKWEMGEHPYQRHALQALDLLGYCAETDDIPISNAIFSAQPDAQSLRQHPRFPDFKAACWEVHKKLLEVIRPKLILCLGCSETLSSFSLVKEWSNDTYQQIDIQGQGERQTASGGKFGSVKFNFLEDRKFLIGIKHPSYIRSRELPVEMGIRLARARELGMGKSPLGSRLA
jgi:hypothetical protein